MTMEDLLNKTWDPSQPAADMPSLAHETWGFHRHYPNRYWLAWNRQEKIFSLRPTTEKPDTIVYRYYALFEIPETVERPTWTGSQLVDAFKWCSRYGDKYMDEYFHPVDPENP